jgi:hypothetical protein
VPLSFWWWLGGLLLLLLFFRAGRLQEVLM